MSRDGGMCFATDADDLIQHGHLWQPWLIRKRRPDIGPRVVPTGGLPGARSFGALRGLLLLRRFERGVDRLQGDPGKRLGQLPQGSQFDRVKIGVTAPRVKTATTSSFAACSIALRTALASSWSL